MRLWVKYCGGCNPHIDRTALVQQVTALLHEKTGQAVDLAYAGDSLPLPPDGVLLIVSGCPTDCAARPAGADRYPTVVVAGTTIQGQQVSAADLVRRTVDALLSCRPL